MVHWIDLRDHICIRRPMNFYRHSEERWHRSVSDTIFYTNRLTVDDYRTMLAEAGFELLYLNCGRYGPGVLAPRDVDPRFAGREFFRSMQFAASRS